MADEKLDLILIRAGWSIVLVQEGAMTESIISVVWTDCRNGLSETCIR